jgi:3-methyladenine DNA glycosylase/8-oxoguanine DNA glycosylase
MPSRVLPLAVPLDLRLTLGPFVRGPGDPAMRLTRSRAARATRTPDGPASVAIAIDGGCVRADAFGPGADRLLDGLPRFLGLHDDPAALLPAHRLVAELARRLRGLRIGASGAVMEALVPAILEQKVTGSEAFRAYRGLVRRYGEAAPGPLGLRLAPAPETLASLPYHAFRPFGVEQRRADVIRRAARVAPRLEEAADMRAEAADARLRSITGVGPWTSAEVRARALGDPDAVSVGDFHLKHLVAWTLAGEPRGTDERMLELLEPYGGQRGRVIRLLEASGLAAPRFGPRMAPHSIAGI